MNLLTTSAWEWQSLLESGTITSQALVTLSLAHIAAHNHSGLHLNALISIAPRDLLLHRAAALDAERATGHLRSPLHGLPIILKDVFPTDFTSSGLPTTAGAIPLASARGTRTCLLARRLLDAGCVLLGTANLTEFCGLKTAGMPIGWSALGGQTQSPFVFGGLQAEKGGAVVGHSSAAGSSSGSAVAVAAGFAPLAIGTETTGSLVIPANRAGVFALKVSKADAPTEGAFALSRSYDSLGGLARCARDLRALTEVVLGRELQGVTAGAEGEGRRFEGLRVGFVDMRKWQFPDWICVVSPEMRDQLVENAAKLGNQLAEELGVKVVTDIALPDTDCLDYEGQTTARLVASAEFKDCFRDFMSSLTGPPIRELKDLIEANAATEISSKQETLIATENDSTSRETVQQAFDFGLKVARGNLDRAMSAAGVDLLIGPGDSDLYTYAALAGYPIGAMPLSTIQYDEKNQRPEGLCVIGKAGSEGLILDLMEAVEMVSPARPLPLPLLGPSSG